MKYHSSLNFPSTRLHGVPKLPKSPTQHSSLMEQVAENKLYSIYISTAHPCLGGYGSVLYIEI